MIIEKTSNMLHGASSASNDAKAVGAVTERCIRTV